MCGDALEALFDTSLCVHVRSRVEQKRAAGKVVAVFCVCVERDARLR